MEREREREEEKERRSRKAITLTVQFDTGKSFHPTLYHINGWNCKKKYITTIYVQYDIVSFHMFCILQ